MLPFVLAAGGADSGSVALSVLLGVAFFVGLVDV